jgi:uncharacterized cupredoxin-like copper-binding protein
MRRLLIALVVAAAVTPLLPPLARGAGRPPAHMLVYAQEWSLWPSRTSVPAGRVVVQLWNRGQDAHDLRIRHVDRRGRMSGATQGVAVTLSGGLTQASWHLKPGRYELYCSMPGHRARGMHAVITVR